MSIHPDDGSTAYECPHHFDCAGECTLTDVPPPVEFHRVLPGTVATWLADIEREISLGACPCEYCGDRIDDHTPSELRSCAADIEAREQEAEALAWWRSQQ